MRKRLHTAPALQIYEREVTAGDWSRCKKTPIMSARRSVDHGVHGVSQGKSKTESCPNKLGKKSVPRAVSPRRLEAASGFAALTARVELVPFPFVDESEIFRSRLEAEGSLQFDFSVGG